MDVKDSNGTITRDGSKHERGETVCIRAGDAAYLARCETAMSVATWRRLSGWLPDGGIEP